MLQCSFENLQGLMMLAKKLMIDHVDVISICTKYQEV